LRLNICDRREIVGLLAGWIARDGFCVCVSSHMCAELCASCGVSVVGEGIVAAAFGLCYYVMSRVKGIYVLDRMSGLKKEYNDGST